MEHSEDKELHDYGGVHPVSEKSESYGIDGSHEIVETSRICFKCKQTKPIDAFYKKGDRRSSRCKTCELALKAAQRQERSRERKAARRRTGVLDISTFEVTQTYDHREGSEILAVIESYADRIASDETRLGNG